MTLISPIGAVKANISSNTKDLISTLKFLKSTLPKNQIDQRPYCEITIKTNEVEFVIAGVKKSLFCISEGPAKATISFLYFLHLVTDRAKIKTNISVGENFMTINGTTAIVDTWFFQDDSILRSIDLPVNYGISNLLKLSLNYTENEIEFNKITQEYHNAFEVLAKDVKHISGKLKKYGFTKDEIEKFVYDKLFKQPKTTRL